MVAELDLQHYQVKVGYLGFMNQYFICVQLIDLGVIIAHFVCNIAFQPCFVVLYAAFYADLCAIT